jgi:hypothetical protein
MGLLRQSPRRLNGPALFFSLRSTIFMGPLGNRGELPIGAWATFLIARCLKLTANAAPQDWNSGFGTTLLDALSMGFQGMASGVRWWDKKSLAERLRQADAPSAHRRPGYSSSGCTPAEPDSASPGEASLTHADEQAKQREPSRLIPWIPKPLQRTSSSKSPGRRLRAVCGMDAPEEAKKRNWASPGEVCLDFLLPIGA